MLLGRFFAGLAVVSNYSGILRKRRSNQACNIKPRGSAISEAHDAFGGAQTARARQRRRCASNSVELFFARSRSPLFLTFSLSTLELAVGSDYSRFDGRTAPRLIAWSQKILIAEFNGQFSWNLDDRIHFYNSAAILKGSTIFSWRVFCLGEAAPRPFHHQCMIVVRAKFGQRVINSDFLSLLLTSKGSAMISEGRNYT